MVGVELLGLDLTDLDLGDGAAPAAVETLRDCVHRHGCALMRGQSLPPPAGTRSSQLSKIWRARQDSNLQPPA